jgi:hypothetical protein
MSRALQIDRGENKAAQSLLKAKQSIVAGINAGERHHGQTWIFQKDFWIE